MAKTEKELKQDLDRVNKLFRDEKKKADKLEGVEKELESSKEELGKVQEELKTQKNINTGLSNDRVKLQKEIEKNSVPADEKLKEDLQAKEEELTKEKAEVKRLSNELSVMNKNNKDLVEGDERNSGLLNELSDAKKEIQGLRNANESLSKKSAAMEGPFPKFSLASAIQMGEVQMGEDEKMMAYQMTAQSGKTLYMAKIHVVKGKVVGVDFEALK